MEIAKQNLSKDSAVAPVLFLHFKDGEQVIAPLSLPPTHEEREVYFDALSSFLQHQGMRLREAVFVFESWYVQAEKGERLNLNVPPSQHPKRQEAITIVGRNAEQTRFTFLMQSFGRDRENRPIFEATRLEEYHSGMKTSTGLTGLLDHLFPAPAKGGDLPDATSLWPKSD